MFYCDDCRIKRNYPERLFQSRGRCEICKKITMCNEVGTENLPILEKDKCQHQETVAINEEGHAGVYCVNCGKQVEKEC